MTDHQCDVPCVIQLKQQLSALMQGPLDVNSYFAKLKILGMNCAPLSASSGLVNEVVLSRGLNINSRRLFCSPLWGELNLLLEHEIKSFHSNDKGQLVLWGPLIIFAILYHYSMGHGRSEYYCHFTYRFYCCGFTI